MRGQKHFLNWDIDRILDILDLRAPLINIRVAKEFLSTLNAFLNQIRVNIQSLKLGMYHLESVKSSARPPKLY